MGRVGENWTVKYSIIICYRDRKEHLKLLRPRLEELFPNAEIIVVEQDDNEGFHRGSLFNVDAGL